MAKGQASDRKREIDREQDFEREGRPCSRSSLVFCDRKQHPLNDLRISHLLPCSSLVGEPSATLDLHGLCTADIDKAPLSFPVPSLQLSMNPQAFSRSSGTLDLHYLLFQLGAVALLLPQTLPLQGMMLVYCCA